MRRFFSKVKGNSRPASRRARLSVEGMEDRTVPSTATLTGNTLQVTADPGLFLFGLPGIPPVRAPRHITFQNDPLHAGKMEVLDNGTVLGRFPVASIKTVNVTVAGLDAVTVDNSVRGLPFATGTTVTLDGTSPMFKPNSLTLQGSRTVSGNETYAAGNGAVAAKLVAGGSSYEFSGAIASVTDLLRTTGPLFIQASGTDVVQTGTDHVTQRLTGLAGGTGGGGTLTYSHKNLVEVDLLTVDAGAALNATAPAAGEAFFVVGLNGTNESATINATPAAVATNVVAEGSDGHVFVVGNAGLVSINGSSSTLAILGGGFGVGVTSGIKRDVTVEGVGRLALTDPGNQLHPEHVTVTESTIAGTGLFGNNLVKVHYDNVGLVQLVTGRLANTYSVVGSKPGALFGSHIEIDDLSTMGLNVVVGLDKGSGLNLFVDNADFLPTPGPASLFISAPGGTFSHPTPNLPNGIEDVTFSGGLTSEVVYTDLMSVTHT
jgi:hypothetical protein